MHCGLDVVNGESNKIVVSIENKSGRNITLENIAGSFHYVDSNRLIKNVCTDPVHFRRMTETPLLDDSFELRDTSVGGWQTTAPLPVLQRVSSSQNSFGFYADSFQGTRCEIRMLVQTT